MGEIKGITLENIDEIFYRTQASKFRSLTKLFSEGLASRNIQEPFPVFGIQLTGSPETHATYYLDQNGRWFVADLSNKTLTLEPIEIRGAKDMVDHYSDYKLGIAACMGSLLSERFVTSEDDLRHMNTSIEATMYYLGIENPFLSEEGNHFIRFS